MLIFDGDVLNATVGNLSKYTEHAIMGAAVNSKGQSNFTSATMIRTNEDGKYMRLNTCRKSSIKPPFQISPLSLIHRIHKWRTRGKKLVPSHESEALENKQKLQMKTFSELAEC